MADFILNAFIFEIQIIIQAQPGKVQIQLAIISLDLYFIIVSVMWTLMT